MATKPVGYRSPFQKKTSPMKFGIGMAMMGLGGGGAIAGAAGAAGGIGSFLGSGGGQALMGALPGIISGLGSLFGRKKRRKEQKQARQQMLAARKAYMGMEFKNPLEGIQNPYADLENPYAENIYEDLTVDRQGADYLREQQQQSQANIMQQMKGVAGSSGVAGLAQQMANVGSQQARQASAQISQQERQNELYRAKGEQQKQKGTFEFEKMMKKSEFDIDIAKRDAQQTYVTAKEQERIENLYGLGLSRLSAADSARSTARSGFISGLGQAAAGIGGTFMPGGANYGAFGGGGGGGGTPQGFNFTTPSFGTNWMNPGGQGGAFGGGTGGLGSGGLGVSLPPAFNQNQQQFQTWDPVTRKFVYNF